MDKKRVYTFGNGLAEGINSFFVHDLHILKLTLTNNLFAKLTIFYVLSNKRSKKKDT